MTWFKVDDSMWSHPKTLGLSHRAMALWVRAGSYAGNHLTDGVIPRNVLALLQATDDDATELVSAGLWLHHVNGYLFHDWNEYQPTRAKVSAERRKNKERQAAYRDRLKNDEVDISRPVPSRPMYAVTNGVSNGVTDPLLPDPFDEFWTVYPRKKGKKAAKESWLSAIEKADPSVIISAAQKYREEPGRTDAFTAWASTWLNQERWNDEYAERVDLPDGWHLRPDGNRVDPCGRLWDAQGYAL